jgi:hypothetical protein
MLYIEQDLTICEIADNHSEYGTTTVYSALVEHNVIETNDDLCCNIDTDEPTTDWSKI